MSNSPEDLPAASPMPPQAPPSPPSSTPSPIAAYVKPQPRAPRSPAQAAQIRVQNRRREYLERNPRYFASLEHELADPLLYDALIRRFQSPEERETEGRTKGYSRVLEVDLLRGEAKLAQLTSQNQHQHLPPPLSTPWLPASATVDADAYIREYANGTDGLGDERSNFTPTATNSNPLLPQQPESKDEGRARWDNFLRRRFVLGRDEDFDYRLVDENDDLDALERRELEDAWFDDEDPDWAVDSPFVADHHLQEGGGGRVDGGGGKRLVGETGIQDF